MRVLNSGQGNKSAAEFTAVLNDIYDFSASANMLLNYIIFFIMTNFNLGHKALVGEFHLSMKQMKKSAEKFAEQYNACVSDMLLPFRNLPNFTDYPDLRRQIDEALQAERKQLLEKKKALSEDSPQWKSLEFEALCNEAYYRLQGLNEQLMEKRR